MNIHFKLATLAAIAYLSAPAEASNTSQKWKQGLSGAKLTSYHRGSIVNSNSTLTVINFCHNGRYSYYKEGSWVVPGQAGGASNRTITGNWNIEQSGHFTMLTYVTDRNEQGSFPIYLENNGRVNIGGTSFAIQQNASGCKITID